MLLSAPEAPRASRERLAQHRNLGKAFYENPATQVRAVDEFRKALALAPDSPRERLNYGLALLRAGKTKEGIAEIEKAQKQDPSIPHTWFNLGMAFKKEGQYDRAAAQFEQMIRLVPDEPVSHYNLAVLYKLAGKRDEALRHFEIAARLNQNLAGPHFQLYNAYRQSGRAQDAARELQEFQEIKARTAGAAVPEDMEWSYYAEIYDTVEPLSEPLALPAVRFEDHKVADGFSGSSGLAVLDTDGDGRPDLLAWSAAGARLFRGGDTRITDSGLGDLRDIVSIAAGDFNNDGFPDLCIITSSGAVLYRNQRGVFRKDAATLPAGRYSKALWLDYDHDYDPDLFLFGERSALVRNNGDAGFSDESARFPFATGRARDAVMFDLIADTNGTDLAVSYEDRAGVLYRDKLAGKFEAQPLEALPAGATGLHAFDVNNDGWTDLAASGLLLVNRQGKLTAASIAGGPHAFLDLANRGLADLIVPAAVWENRGLGQFGKTSATLPAFTSAVEADFDGDGLADLAILTPDGALHMLRNRTATRNQWVRIALNGIKNPKLAADSEVEVKSGAAYQKRLYAGIPLVFGLGEHKNIDTVRITWPNGLIQNEPEQTAGKALVFKEAQRLSGSCPMIFTWNGARFQFLTDVLGVAPLGAASGDGGFFPVDHDEYVQIPGEQLQPLGQDYELRITEDLREVSYIDEVKLLALDHPISTEVFTNDKFKAPPFPEFRLFGIGRRVYPRRATDGSGHDVLARLLHRDRSYPDAFRRDYAGTAETHVLDLDFAGAAPDNRAVLVLHGWVDWADGSTFLSASQAGKSLALPSLQVKDAAGNWRTVVADMGIPAGKPKTIAVDLTGRFLSASREIRILTNLCVYWDEVFLGEDADAPQTHLTPMSASVADLRFRGFSRPTIDPARRQPESFDYDAWMPASMWNPTPGKYTRYGDVRELLAAADDRMVIMGSGDELRLRFPGASLPQLPPGWKRDFLLLVDGWAKDGDANTAYSQTVEPLPFHGMSSYPYPAGEYFPDDAAHREYQRTYNTRAPLRLIRPLRPPAALVSANANGGARDVR